jgi:hypothetical protein
MRGLSGVTDHHMSLCGSPHISFILLFRIRARDGGRGCICSEGVKGYWVIEANPGSDLMERLVARAALISMGDYNRSSTFGVYSTRTAHVGSIQAFIHPHSSLLDVASGQLQLIL